MGEVIRKDAAAADILADARKTLQNARARGGDWQKLADDKLGATIALADSIEARVKTARETGTPLFATLAAANGFADKFLGRVSDDVWNAIGRPQVDPAYDILFPGGIDYYAEGDVEEQPIRMDLLAELLEAGVHPRLPKATATSLATEVRAQGATLAQAVDAAGPARARIDQLERVTLAVARTAQIGLSNLKRMFKASGFSEAEIHTVIPDRPVKKAAKPTDPAPSGPAAPTS